MDYQDINHACLKENYLTLFINQIVDDCANCEIYLFMDGFSISNQINILLTNQPKTAFICPLGTFSYQKIPFSLKNVGATFHRETDYAFHDIK